MSDTKFTPGPWSIQQWSKDDFGHKAMIHVGEGDNYGNPLCRVFMGGEGGLFTSKEDVEANAKLIAAAPDMFDIISELYKYGMESGHKGVLFPQIEAAYLKVIATN